MVSVYFTMNETIFHTGNSISLRVQKNKHFQEDIYAHTGTYMHMSSELNQLYVNTENTVWKRIKTLFCRYTEFYLPKDLVVTLLKDNVIYREK